MKEKIVNQKMKEIIDFFSIKDKELQEVLGENAIDENYDFSQLSITQGIALAKKYCISLDVLEEVFINKENEVNDVKRMLKLFKPRGIIRKIDELGRIVLPIEYRTLLALVERDLVEIFLNEKGEIVIRPQKKCSCCGRNQDLIENNETYICKSCIEQYEEELKKNKEEEF